MSKGTKDYTVVIGRATADPEVKYTPSGTAFARVGLAVNRYRGKDAEGNRREEAVYYNAVFWNKMAEMVGQFVRKGVKMYVRGELEFRKDPKDPNDSKVWVDLRVNEVEILEKMATTQAAPAPPPKPAAPTPASWDDFDDDIPF